MKNSFFSIKQISEELEGEKERGQLERVLCFERLRYRALAEGLIPLTKAAELLLLPIQEIEAGLKGPQGTDVNSSQ